MKLIFSRKGMDSAAGGLASPILPDGRLLSLPIPGDHAFRLSDWPAPGWDLEALVHDLSGGRINAQLPVHADPQLIAPPGERETWRAALGQHGAAESHLQAQGVSAGDCFLFYGWFRQVELHKGRWRYVPAAPNLHVLFGWLRVGKMLDANDAVQRESCLRQFPLLAKHPHIADWEQYTKRANRIYLADQSLRLQGRDFGGAGHWSHLSLRRVLTWPGQNRSLWRLPAWMAPEKGSRLSAHEKPERWQMSGRFAQLSNVPRGQEFVLHTPNQRSLKRWLARVFEDGIAAG